MNIKRCAAGLCAALLALTGTTHVASAAEEQMPLSLSQQDVNRDMKLWYGSPAKINSAENSGGEWMQESLPLGNGNLGNLIFGGVGKERIHFNEKTLWTGGPSTSRPNYQFGNKQNAYTAKEIEDYRKILDDKSKKVFNDAEGLKIGGGNAIRFPGESNLNKGSYQDFGDIWLDYSPIGVNDNNVKDYRRELDMQTGIASTSFKYKGVEYTREHFVSYPDQVMVTKLDASKKGKLDINIAMELNNNNLSGEDTFDEKEHTHTIAGTVKDNGLKFRTTMKVIPKGGTVTLDKNKKQYVVKDADSIVIIMGENTNYKNDYPVYRDNEIDLAKTVDERVKKCAGMAYDDLKTRHVEDHQGFFDRVSMDLGETEPYVATDDLIDDYRKGEHSTYLETLAFQYGRYLTIAGSRGTLPSNLVGLWTIGDSAWTGDYHFNVNVQMNYWPVYETNLAECGTTFTEYMESLREPGRLTAERVHGIEGAVKDHKGFTVHTENNPFGMTAPSNAQEYGWNPTGAAWAVQNLWQEYEFTQDEQYLKDTIYPIMKEAALFWDNYLWTSDYQVINDPTSPYNGQKRLVVAPSFSAEQGPTAVGTTYDQSLVWELYKECIAAGEIVGESKEQLDLWRAEMQKLDPIEINETHGIKEWYEETRVGKESGHNKSYAKAGNLAEVPVPNSGWSVGHPGEMRHASHLVGLYPGTLITKDNKEFMDAALVSLTERGEYSTGWSKANKINLWARTGNGDEAYVLLNNLIGGNTSGLQYNLFDSHGTNGGETMFNGGRVWQIDGNFGLTAGVTEMLLQSQNGYTEFLPAIPSAWDKGEVKGLKARGNFTIDEKWFNNKAKTFTVTYDGPKESSKFTGSYENITSAVVKEGDKVVEATKEGDKISFTAVKGHTYTIDMTQVDPDGLKAQAEAFLHTIHPDLVNVKKELTDAITSNSSTLNDVLEKAETADRTYRDLIANEEKVYLLNDDNGLKMSDIDAIYNELEDIRQMILDNTADLDCYAEMQVTLRKDIAILREQTNDKVVSFSKPSGELGADKTLTLSQTGQYDIRYTTDGTIPTYRSEIYKNTLTLASDKDTVVRAALFDEEHRVSPVFTNKYVITGVKADSAALSHDQVWGGYEKEKMFDGNTTTRWASKQPDKTKPLAITLSLHGEQTVDQVKFDQFVSRNNGIKGFEIQAKIGEAYETVYTGTKMGDESDKVGNVVEGGYHAYYTASFTPVTTSSLKIILKPGYHGEPSLFEVTPMSVSTPADGQGDPAELNAIIAKAKAADRNSEDYIQAEEDLKKAFEYAIPDGERHVTASQDVIDSRTVFLTSHYDRLGYGETDKSELGRLIALGDEANKGGYTRDSIYRMNKVLVEAKAVMADESVRQPAVDRAVAALQEALEGLEETGCRQTVLHAGDMQGSWITVNGYRATDKDNSGKLTVQFTGSSVSVKTIKANDHGKMQVIMTDSANHEVYNELIDCYNDTRVEGVELFSKILPVDTYTISFERKDKNSNATGGGWVEVGDITVCAPYVETVDRSVLQNEVNEAKKLVETNYTAESWKVFHDEIVKAENVLAKADKDTCTAEMEDAAEALHTAREQLQEVIHTEALEQKIDEAKKIKEEGYTAESYDALQQTIHSAEALLAGKYTQDEVNAKTSELSQAIHALRADKTALQAEYDKVKEQGDITDESWKKYQKVKAEAKKVLDRVDATPKAVADALKALQNFKFDHVVKPESPKPTDKPTPSPEVTPTPTPTLSPEVTPTPIPTVAPTPTATPEVTTQPMATLTPATTAKPTVKPEEKPHTSDKEDKRPATGDARDALPMAVVLAVALAGIVVLKKHR